MKITEQMLSAWIDEALSPEQMKAVGQAVEADPALKEKADALRSVGEQLRGISVESPVTAEKMAADVRREIRLSTDTPAERLPWRVWVPIAACACLVMFALWPQPSSQASADGSVAQAEIEFVESELPGVSPMVYTDYDSGWTVIWLDEAELESGI